MRSLPRARAHRRAFVGRLLAGAAPGGSGAQPPAVERWRIRGRRRRAPVSPVRQTVVDGEKAVSAPSAQGPPRHLPWRQFSEPTPEQIADRRRRCRALRTAGCFVLPTPWDIGSARRLAGQGWASERGTNPGNRRPLRRLRRRGGRQRLEPAVQRRHGRAGGRPWRRERRQCRACRSMSKSVISMSMSISMLPSPSRLLLDARPTAQSHVERGLEPRPGRG